jgi:hypothetical protein
MNLEDVHRDIAYNDENDKYFSTKLPMPFDFHEIIKCLYRRYNETHQEQIEIPLPEQISDEFDKPLFSKNQIRCEFHHEIDCDYCSLMDCYRKAYLLTRHLKYLGHLDGIDDLSNHEPESNVATTFTTFKHEKTKQAIDYERREAQRQTRMMNMRDFNVPRVDHRSSQPAQDIRGDRRQSPVVETVSGIPVHKKDYHHPSENHVDTVGQQQQFSEYGPDQSRENHEYHENYEEFYGEKYNQEEHNEDFYQNEEFTNSNYQQQSCGYEGNEERNEYCEVTDYNDTTHSQDDFGYQEKFNTSFSSDDIYNGFSPRSRTSKNRERNDQSELASAVTPVPVSKIEERVNDEKDDLGPDGDTSFHNRSSLRKFKPRGLKFEPPSSSSSRTSSATWSKRKIGRGRGCLPINIPESLLENNRTTKSQRPISSADNTSIVSGTSRLSLGRGYRPRH